MVTEVKLPVRGINLAAKLWHPEKEKKVIGLHGWLDNAASFDLLAPLLTNTAFLAIDQAGTGFSDFRPLSATYHLWDDLLDVLAILDSMQWQKVSLVGHSRGAFLACLLAACFPEKIEQLILLDGFVYDSNQSENCIDNLSQFLTSYNKNTDRRHYYRCRDELIRVRAQASRTGLEQAAILATRAIHQDVNGYYWRTDARLKLPSAVRFTSIYQQQILDRITQKSHVILAERGLGRLINIQTMLKNREAIFTFDQLTGHHHFHLDVQVQEIARICLNRL